MTAPDLTNRFLSVEIWIPFIIGAIAAVFGYGTLSADVSHKADQTTVAVMAAQITAIADDVADNKRSTEKARVLAQTNHDILVKISAAVGVDPE